MGFYGNITNTVKTNLQFDKKYCNRFELEGKCAGDGVVSGRYVLIEYDLSWNSDGSTNDTFEIIYTRTVDGVEQFSSAPDFSIAVTPWPDIIYRAVEVQQLSPLLSVYTNKYYIGVLNDENKYDTVMEKQKTALANLADLKNRFTVGLISEAVYNAQKTEIYTNHNNELRDAGGTYLKLASNSESNYVTNFNIDTNYYGDGRGWDSTVWMKSYDTQGTPKYVMVAELNSIVPTFAISVDAPTEIPQSPHFDATNTNIFYTMHLQPQWGFQVKAAEGNSDSSENRTFYTYDTENNVISSNQQNQPLNIFYNKEGFNSNKKHYISNATDKISWEATGKSGKYYNNPNHEPGAPVVGNQVDMYEFSMLLPSLGNAVSEMWDQVYDVGEGNARKQDTAWKDALVNLANEKNMSTSHETLAGTINIAHKLLGMIITTTDDNEVNYNNNYIYYNETNDKYYRINKKPVMEKVASEDISADNTYYVQVSNDYYQVANPNIEGFDYYEIKSYEYIKTELPAFANNMSTVNGVLLKMAQLLGLNDVHTVDTNTVQGCINHLNAIINIFSDLRPTEFAIVNEEGKIVSADWTTAQAITYTNGHDNAATALDSDDKNYWIQMDLNPTDRRLTVTHALALDHKVEGNDDIKTDFDSDEVTKEAFELYTPIVDNAGHIIGKNKETITLPKGLRSFTTNGINNSATDLGAEEKKGYKYTATNIKDEFAINVGNKWIESKIDGDTLIMAHSLYTIDTNRASDSNLNGDEEGKDTNTLSLLDITHDEGGHITANKQHTYTLPYSYKYLKTSGFVNDKSNDLSTINAETNTVVYPSSSQAKANKGSDSLSINPKNYWIQTKLIQNADGGSTFEIAHTKQVEIPVTSSNKTFSSTEKSFVIVNDVCDEAGHITNRTSTTYTLGNNFSSFEIPQESGIPLKITPTTPYDSLYMTGDSWVQIKGTEDDQSLTFEHNTPSVLNNTEINQNTDATLNFAGTFTIPKFKYDEKGHISKAGTYTLTLPTLSRNDTGTGNVLIASAIDTTDNGKINFTKEYIGKLSLDEYEHNDTDVYSTLLATDTLNSALNKLESGYLSNKAAIDLINGEGDTSSLTDLTTQVNANKAAIEVINGEEAGSIAAAITAATAAIRGTDTENTIESLNANKLDNTTYTITGSDGTTVEGTIVEILGELYNKIIELSSGSGEETT